MLKITSPTQMYELGSRIGSRLTAGDLLILTGPLGAGKTALAQGIGRSLGISKITSPTFVIAKEYSGRIPLIHIDAYRLISTPNSRIEFEDLDLEANRETSITVIEWGSGLGIKPTDGYLEIEIKFGEVEDDRLISFKGHGERWEGFKL